MNSGMVYAALAFFLWGLFPLYFHAIDEVPPIEILANRMLWSLLFLAIVLAARRQWAWLGQVLAQPRVLLGFAASAFLLSGNWFIYIWSVNNGHVVDASLGYFITPLVNVMFGFVLLHERLRRLQWLALGLAAAGVVWLAWQAGQFPWISLLLAASFGGYGLLRKTAKLGPLEGLALETLILFPFALVYVAWLTWHGQNSFLNTYNGVTRSMLALTGPVTAIPLLLFAAGARRIPLSVLGFLQYIAPILQLICGLWFFHETFSQQRLIGFATIWIALILYAAEGWWTSRQRLATVAA